MTHKFPFFTYVYYDPRDGSPIYVGKGKKKPVVTYRMAHRHWVGRAKNPVLRAILNKLRTDKQVAGIIELNNRPEVKAKRSASGKARWNNPDFRARCSKALLAHVKSPAYKKLKSAEQKSCWADPEHRATRIAKMKLAAAQPERRAKLLASLAKSNMNRVGSHTVGAL